MSEPRSTKSFLIHIGRALLLRCPACGTRPLFEPWYRVRSLRDWFTPLDGCPSCGYPYEREAGYYLMAIWAINYGVGSVIGILIYLVLEWQTHLSLPALLAAVLIPVCAFNILFARHAKALFLAVDLFFDPHEKGGGDDRGNVPREPIPPVEPAGSGEDGRPCRPEPVLR